MVSKLIAVSLFTLSAPLLAASNWVEASNVQSHTAFVDRASVATAGPIRSVRVLRNYDQVVSLGVDTLTRQDLYPHQSVKLRFVVNCSSGQITLYSWEMYRGNFGEGDLVWSDSHSGAPDFSAPQNGEEIAALATACGSRGAAVLARSSQ